jgi:hypothetical protein
MPKKKILDLWKKRSRECHPKNKNKKFWAQKIDTKKNIHWNTCLKFQQDNKITNFGVKKQHDCKLRLYKIRTSNDRQNSEKSSKYGSNDKNVNFGWHQVACDLRKSQPMTMLQKWDGTKTLLKGNLVRSTIRKPTWQCKFSTFLMARL